MVVRVLSGLADIFLPFCIKGLFGDILIYFADHLLLHLAEEFFDCILFGLANSILLCLTVISDCLTKQTLSC